MSNFQQKLPKVQDLEDKYNIRLCIHEWNGEQEITVCRVIKEEKDRFLPIPQIILDELKPILIEEYGNKPFGVSPKGLTNAEIIEEQEAWNWHCELANIGT